MAKVCLAVDVGKKSSCYALYRTVDITAGSEGMETLIRPKKIPPSRQRLEELLSEAKGKASGDGLAVAMESTGIYSKPLEDFFRGRGIEVIVINPIITGKKAIDGLRETKTDKKDTRKIALVYFRGQANRQREVTDDELRRQSYSRFLERRKSDLARMKTLLKSVLYNVAPEYEDVAPGSNIFSDSMMALIRKYPCVGSIRSAREEDMVETMVKAGGERQRKAATEFVSRLKKACDDSISQTRRDSPECEEIVRLIDDIRREQKTVDSMERKLIDLCKDTRLFNVLLTFEGIGEALAAHLTAEIGNMERFGKRTSLQSFAGIDPKRRQSSQTLDSNGAIVKRGNSHLRRWLTMATLVMVMHKQFGGVAETVEAYYRKKRGSKENGGATHHHLYALIAATNKLVRIIYGRYADKTVAA